MQTIAFQGKTRSGVSWLPPPDWKEESVLQNKKVLRLTILEGVTNITYLRTPSWGPHVDWRHCLGIFFYKACRPDRSWGKRKEYKGWPDRTRETWLLFSWTLTKTLPDWHSLTICCNLYNIICYFTRNKITYLHENITKYVKRITFSLLSWFTWHMHGESHRDIKIN